MWNSLTPFSIMRIAHIYWKRMTGSSGWFENHFFKQLDDKGSGSGIFQLCAPHALGSIGSGFRIILTDHRKFLILACFWSWCSGWVFQNCDLCWTMAHPYPEDELDGWASLVEKGPFLLENRVECKSRIVQKHDIPCVTCACTSQAPLPQMQMGVWEATLSHLMFTVLYLFPKSQEGRPSRPCYSKWPQWASCRDSIWELVRNTTSGFIQSSLDIIHI